MTWLKANWKKIAAVAVALVIYIVGAITGGGIRGCIDKALIEKAVEANK